jgi:hypothetical protein
MQSESLKHDHAMAMARAVMDIVSPCIREEEKRDAFDLFYEACKAGLQSYEMHADRMRRRVEPGKN